MSLDQLLQECSANKIVGLLFKPKFDCGVTY